MAALHAEGHVHSTDLAHVPPRTAWTVTALRDVVGHLTTETDHRFLSRRIFTSSASYRDLRAKRAQFAQSLAAASALGFLLGLGDRHPDNILFDVPTGEVVHIDYNVIFDAGLRLEVPERVPFRLTPSLVRALGSAGGGVNGPFRICFERVVALTRRRIPDLLVAVEASLMDPLVDWAAERHEGTARLEMDLGVTLQLLINKIDLGQPDFTHACSHMRARLREAVTALQSVFPSP